MKLGHKLLLAPVVTAAVVLTVGQIDSWLLSRSSSEAVAAVGDHINEVRSLGGLQADVNQAHVEVYRMMTIIGSLDEAAIQAKRKDLAGRSTQTLEQLSQQLEKEPAGSGLRTGMEAARQQLTEYFKKADGAIDLASVDPNTGVAAMQGADEAYSGLSRSLNAVQAQLVEHASQDAEQKAAEAARTHWLLSLLSLAAAAAVVAMSWVVLRKVAQSLDQASRIARAVADGDLTLKVETDRKDELGELLRALSTMKDSLLSTVVHVRSASDSIGTASAEIASGNQDLSARTEQAASSLQQTAASMEQLTGTVQSSVDAARQANQLASSASAIAVRGGQVVGQVVTTMDQINHSSKKISDIIGTIDGIAFQTNILALNAAVEAARAGEQGRGFAVVAAEVRSLAQRSAEAAKEIKDLISASVDKVDVGTRLVDEAGQTMGEIVASVQRVTDIIAEITAAASEQGDGIGQVNVAVTQLDQMTQQNAALVEESAAAAESLKDQAARLSEVVAVFRVGAARA
jgi:methyl-accepting chemotaxis protein